MVPEPEPSSEPADALEAFLDAWAALCASVGRRSLTAREGARGGVDGHRGALAAILTELGYPEALRDGAGLGAALRRLRGRRDRRGRHLSQCQGRKGAIWYVVTPTVPRRSTAGVDRARVFEILTCVEGGPTVEELRVALRETEELWAGVPAAGAGAEEVGRG